VGALLRLKCYGHAHSSIVANYDTSLLTPSAPSTGPPTLRGYLNKYANVARGYNTRWFVLKDGVLSCMEILIITSCTSLTHSLLDYRHQDDENVASRGSIAMKTAIFKTSPGSGGLRFEIHHTPSRGHQGVQKWYMRANHPVEARRWAQAINKNIEWHKQRIEDDRLSTDFNQRKGLSTPSLKGSMTSDAMNKKRNENNGMESSQSSIAGDLPPLQQGESLSRAELSQLDALDDSSEEVTSADRPPFDASFSIQGNYVHVQVGLISEYLQDVLKSETPSKISESMEHLKESISSVDDMLGEYLEMVTQREEWWKKQLKREQKRQDVWEQSLQAVVKEGQELEQELRNRTRRKSKIFSGSFRETPTVKSKRSQLPLNISGPLFEPPPDEHVSLEPRPSPNGQASPPAADGQISTPSDVSTPKASATDQYFPLSISTISGWTPNEAESFVDTDEEDEFFDAIETNNLPNLVVSQVLKTHEDHLLEHNKAQYVGYKILRKRLVITSDNRPPTSLWSVLKNSIGKDLTRISFPVFFNEPTGMLQRMVSTSTSELSYFY
jgi:oxysterol-binding protein 1